MSLAEDCQTMFLADQPVDKEPVDEDALVDKEPVDEDALVEKEPVDEDALVEKKPVDEDALPDFSGVSAENGWQCYAVPDVVGNASPDSWWLSHCRRFCAMNDVVSHYQFGDNKFWAEKYAALEHKHDMLAKEVERLSLLVAKHDASFLFK